LQNETREGHAAVEGAVSVSSDRMTDLGCSREAPGARVGGGTGARGPGPALSRTWHGHGEQRCRERYRDAEMQRAERAEQEQHPETTTPGPGTAPGQAAPGVQKQTRERREIRAGTEPEPNRWSVPGGGTRGARMGVDGSGWEWMGATMCASRESGI
jgi:hypothetical protein